MPRFSYSAFQPDGREVSGTIDAPDEMQALKQIAGRGLTPVDLSAGSLKGPWWSRELSLTGASSVKPRDLEAFFDNFATLLRAQLSLPRALAFCEGQTRNHELAQTISELRSDIENGQTLATALGAHSGVIPDRLQAILRLGESSNTLPDAVTRTAQMLNQEAGMRRDLQSAMVYPIILLVMSLLVLAMIVFYLAPTLAPVFATAGAEPPFVINAMAALRTVVLENTVIVLALGATAVLALLVFRKSIGALLLLPIRRLPIVKSYLSKRETLRFSQTLTLMLSAGATLPDALNAAQDGAGDGVWRDRIEQARLDVEAGGSLSDALDGFQMFDLMTLSLLHAGEESDDVVGMLTSATNQLQNATRNTLQQVLRLLTPALTLLIGGLVGLLIISTISAILDLNDIAF